MAGARKPSGRRSQISGCIRPTVHHGRHMSTTHTGPIVSAEVRTALETPLEEPTGSASAQGLASGAATADAQTIPTLRAGDVVDGFFAWLLKGRLIIRRRGP